MSTPNQPGRVASRTTIGTLGARGIATVDGNGVLTMCDQQLDVEWMVGSESWRTVATDPSTRQSVADGMPVVTTKISVPGGDIVQRCYGVAGNTQYAVCDFTNDSAGPVALALIVRAHPGGRIKRVDGTDHVLRVNDLEVLTADKPWQQWALAQDELTLRDTVRNHATQPGTVHATKMKGQRSACIALVWPLPHQTSVRVALPLAPGAHARVDPISIASLADSDAVARGWTTQLDRAMRVEIDDPALQSAIDGARVSVILRSGADKPRPDADDAVTLEDWGLDAEAAAVWKRLSIRDRKRASGREANSVAGWVRVKTHLGVGASVPMQPARFLQAVRDTVLTETDDGVDMFSGFPSEWLGRSIAVHDAPVRGGRVSFAVRWHGGRPALLWDAPSGTRLSARTLDPAFSIISAGAGEQLLAEPPPALLAMAPAPREGERIEEPGSFL